VLRASTSTLVRSVALDVDRARTLLLDATFQKFATCVRASTFRPRCAGNDLATRPRGRDDEWVLHEMSLIVADCKSSPTVTQRQGDPRLRQTDITAALRSGAKSFRATVMLIAYALQRWEVRNGALGTSK
jgi:hypothetical protein